MPIVAQDFYQPLVMEDTHWKNCRTFTENDWPCGQIFGYQIAGDTLVEGLAYKKLYQREFLPNGESGGAWESYDWPLQIQNENLVGFIREDVSGRKVYWRDASGQSICAAVDDEVLLYDFALEVGDTLSGCLLSGAGPVIVSAIDTVDIYGAERLIYQLSTGMELIGGVGYSSGLLQPPVAQTGELSFSLLDYCIGVDLNCGVILPRAMISPYHEWHLREIVHGGPDYWIKTWEYRFQDTVWHDDLLYWQLEERQEVDRPDWQPLSYLYRESAGKVYRYPGVEENDTEMLLYDFTLSAPGDTFQLYSSIEETFLTLRVDTIETIILTNGDQRKRITWEHNHRLWYWIEGVGANDYPFLSEYSFGHEIDGARRNLQCFYSTNDLEQPLWSNDLIPGCYDYLVQNEEAKQHPILIYPNPSSDKIYVDKVPQRSSFALYSIDGVLLMYSASGDSEQLILDVSGLPQGLYFWKIYFDDQQLIRVGRFVKQ